MNLQATLGENQFEKSGSKIDFKVYLEIKVTEGQVTKVTERQQTNLNKSM